MHIVTKKSEAKQCLDKVLDVYHLEGIHVCVNELYKQLLIKKVKFPILQFCADTLFDELPSDKHVHFCDKVEELKTEGGNVILGKILQNRLANHFDESLAKATEYISKADIWYVCDIIGERVFGYALLHQPDKTIPEIKRLSNHESNWVVRSLGAGIHYAIKKDLDEKDAKIVFPILLSMANTWDKEIRQGVGWAAKTTARFHPEIIDFYQEKIHDKGNVANWFRTKIRIGLNRNDYAKGN